MQRAFDGNTSTALRFGAVLLIAGVAAVSGCKKPVGNWAASRESYCQNLTVVRSDAQLQLDKAAADLAALDSNVDSMLAQGSAASEPEAVHVVRRNWERQRRCDEILRDLSTLAGRLGGFAEGTSAVTRGRGDVDIEAVGMSLSFGVDPVRSAAVEVSDKCPTGGAGAVSKVVADAEKKALAELDHDVALCRGVAAKAQ